MKISLVRPRNWNYLAAIFSLFSLLNYPTTSQAQESYQIKTEVGKQVIAATSNGFISAGEAGAIFEHNVPRVIPRVHCGAQERKGADENIRNLFNQQNEVHDVIKEITALITRAKTAFYSQSRLVATEINLPDNEFQAYMTEGYAQIDQLLDEKILPFKVESLSIQKQIDIWMQYRSCLIQGEKQNNNVSH